MKNDVQKSDRAFIIVSDIEMSCGGEVDDFVHTSYLSEFISQYNEARYSNIEVDLVFNGDTFDFLKTQIDSPTPHLIDEAMALEKLAKIESAHAEFFKALESFVKHDGPARRVHFIVGNHDQEILFPKVQDRIVALCGNSGQIFFPGFEMRAGDLLIEHGSQKDQLFEVPPQKPFLNFNGKKILNLPWTSVTIINTLIPYRSEFHALDRIKPKMEVFERVPELKEWMLGRLWNYWTNDYLKDYVKSSDPLKKISWSMIKEAFKRSLFFNPDVEVGEAFAKKLEHEEHVKVTVVGHVHDPKIFCNGNRKVIQAGCFRDEFMLEDNGQNYVPIAKSYTEVLFKNNKTISSNLVEVSGPEIEKWRHPKPLEEYRKILQEKISVEKAQKAEEQLGAKALETPSALARATKKYQETFSN
ncbi:MAG: hypothetical protein KC478_06525 [Bacteriovoracaceae bacterium]|nr:hypothetical protein [Bacteriovoracaceae bacterium]